jgi:DNA-binding SARP family transcriptional activator
VSVSRRPVRHLFVFAFVGWAVRTRLVVPCGKRPGQRGGAVTFTAHLDLDIRVLGAFDVVVRGASVDLGSHRQRLLTAMLSLECNRPVLADVLIEELWGDRPPTDAANGLQSFVSRIRRALAACKAPGVAVASKAGGYILTVDPERIDAQRFRELARRGRHPETSADPAESISALRSALALWRGPALAGFTDRPFAAAEAAGLEQSRLDATEALADALLAVGDASGAVAVLEPLTATAPFREPAWERLMLALYRTGRQADALRAYATVRRTLVEELGVEPGNALRRLEHLILGQDPALDVGPPCASITPTRPEVHPASPCHNLPAPVGPILGWQDELTELDTLLSTERALTLWGPGGAGKTRLTLELASRSLGRFPDGVWFVELAPLNSADLIGPAVLAAVGVLVGNSEADPLDALCTHLAPRQALLVLDNCEHLIDATATLVGALLRRCASLRILTSSREPLGVAGERLWAVPPLVVPDSDDLDVVESSQAARLFCERAR